MKHFFQLRFRLGLVPLLYVALQLAPAAQAEYHIRDICRVKGQEENTLHGFGLVVGLKGTGDGDLPTTRALAQTMRLMGNALPKDQYGKTQLQELKNAKNVAMVFITATIPAEGGREGGRIDCAVNAISAKSLQGGYLMVAPLLGPRPGSDRIFAFASGQITVDDPEVPTAGKISFGCRIEQDIYNPYLEDGRITLVLKSNHASFETAQEVEYAVNGDQEFSNLRVDGHPLAHALDSKNIQILVPELYRENLVEFVSAILNLRMVRPPRASRVVINERAGVIVIGSEVRVLPVAVTHKNLTIEAGGEQPANSGFVPVEPDSTTADPSARLKSLVDALNALNVETQDIIDIIKGLHREGALWGDLILE